MFTVERVIVCLVVAALVSKIIALLSQTSDSLLGVVLLSLALALLILAARITGSPEDKE